MTNPWNAGSRTLIAVVAFAVSCALLDVQPLQAQVDACFTDNGGCSVNATCESTESGITCTCMEGFEGDGVTCEDIDECATGDHFCSPNASCTNMPGSYTCTCNGGFEGDGVTCTPAPVTVALEPVDDNTIYSENGDLSNGAGDFIFAGKVGLLGSGSIRRALLKFDLQAIPAGSSISDVTLVLYLSKTIATSAGEFSLHRVTADWGEGTSHALGEEGGGANATSGDATWTHRFHSEAFWTAPGGDFSPTASASTLVGGSSELGPHSWTSAALAGDVYDWVNNLATNFGWLLRGGEATSSSARRFNSRENSSTNTRPVLTITYTPPATSATLVLISPSEVTGGSAFDVTVTARTVNGGNPEVDTGYRGTVHFTSGDAAATLPEDYTFTEADSGSRTFSVTLNTAGRKTLNVTDTANASLTSTDVIDVRGATTTTLTSSDNPSTVGSEVTFTASVTSATIGNIEGTVTFKNGATTMGTGTLGSPATFTTSELSAGSHSITAVYEGDANFNGSTSAVLTQSVETTVSTPAGFFATAASATSVSLEWLPVDGATSYEVYRSTSLTSAFEPLPSTTSTSMTDSPLSSATTYLYKVRAIGPEGTSAFSGVDLATTITYVDSTLAGVTIKAEDVERLRTAVNAVRAAANRAPASFNDGTLAGVMVKRIHLIELRTALDEARQALAHSQIGYTDSEIAAGTTAVKAAHWLELRSGTQ